METNNSMLAESVASTYRVSSIRVAFVRSVVLGFWAVYALGAVTVRWRHMSPWVVLAVVLVGAILSARQEGQKRREHSATVASAAQARAEMARLRRGLVRTTVGAAAITALIAYEYARSVPLVADRFSTGETRRLWLLGGVMLVVLTLDGIRRIAAISRAASERR
jgi:F0F1-type ATP synthase assembly protein I